jgi:hypothetical protein
VTYAESAARRTAAGALDAGGWQVGVATVYETV